MSVIPLVDLQAPHRQIAEELQTRLAECFESGSFILGEHVAAFERAFANFCGVRHCVGVGSGTDALEMMLRAAGIGAGDDVIVPANSFIASALAVVRAGATPIFVDSNPGSHLLTGNTVAAALTPRTKAILAVHLYGQMAPVEELQTVAEAAGVLLLEDAAQAHGATRHGKGPAAIGLAAGSSFYPSKNLGAYGDGGAVLTNSDDIARAVRALRNYGSEVKYHHPQIGFNTRLDAVQAIVLSIKVKRLAEWNEARQHVARRYDDLLAGVDAVGLPQTLSGNRHVWHLYVVRVPRRDHVLRRLNEAGIGASVHYPIPIPHHGAFKHLGYKSGDFPAAEAAAQTILSLPLFPEITVEQQRRVVAALEDALRS